MAWIRDNYQVNHVVSSIRARSHHADPAQKSRRYFPDRSPVQDRDQPPASMVFTAATFAFTCDGNIFGQLQQIFRNFDGGYFHFPQIVGGNDRSKCTWAWWWWWCSSRHLVSHMPYFCIAFEVGDAVDHAFSSKDFRVLYIVIGLCRQTDFQSHFGGGHVVLTEKSPPCVYAQVWVLILPFKIQSCFHPEEI